MASVVVRMADGTKKAAVNLPGTLTIGQLLQTTQQRWNLPSNTDYDARLDRTGVQLDTSATLDSVGVEENDVIVILPRLVGGQQ
ncbi:hypothetical protein [Microcoleus anatoxicus]|uniref:hypothetical protein n=1 Tax=Microcoleus anatoxicus TaxID=2705319 RepID=UPI0030C95BE0